MNINNLVHTEELNNQTVQSFDSRMSMMEPVQRSSQNNIFNIAEDVSQQKNKELKPRARPSGFTDSGYRNDYLDSNNDVSSENINPSILLHSDYPDSPSDDEEDDVINNNLGIIGDIAASDI